MAYVDFTETTFNKLENAKDTKKGKKNLLNHFLKQTKDIGNWTNPQTLFMAAYWLSRATTGNLNDSRLQTEEVLKVNYHTKAGDSNAKTMNERINILRKKLSNYKGWAHKGKDFPYWTIYVGNIEFPLYAGPLLPAFEIPTMASEELKVDQENLKEHNEAVFNCYQNILGDQIHFGSDNSSVTKRNRPKQNQKTPQIVEKPTIPSGNWFTRWLKLKFER